MSDVKVVVERLEVNVVVMIGDGSVRSVLAELERVAAGARGARFGSGVLGWRPVATGRLVAGSSRCRCVGRGENGDLL